MPAAGRPCRAQPQRPRRSSRSLLALHPPCRWPPPPPSAAWGQAAGCQGPAPVGGDGKVKRGSGSPPAPKAAGQQPSRPPTGGPSCTPCCPRSGAWRQHTQATLRLMICMSVTRKVIKEVQTPSLLSTPRFFGTNENERLAHGAHPGCRGEHGCRLQTWAGLQGEEGGTQGRSTRAPRALPGSPAPWHHGFPPSNLPSEGTTPGDVFRDSEKRVDGRAGGPCVITAVPKRFEICRAQRVPGNQLPKAEMHSGVFLESPQSRDLHLMQAHVSLETCVYRGCMATPRGSAEGATVRAHLSVRPPTVTSTVLAGAPRVAGRCGLGPLGLVLSMGPKLAGY